MEIDSVIGWEQAFHGYMTSNHSDILKNIVDEGDISSDTEESLKSAIDNFKKSGLAS